MYPIQFVVVLNNTISETELMPSPEEAAELYARYFWGLDPYGVDEGQQRLEKRKAHGALRFHRRKLTAPRRRWVPTQPFIAWPPFRALLTKGVHYN